MDNTFIQEKLLPRLTFNPGLALTGFRTTWPSCIKPFIKNYKPRWLSIISFPTRARGIIVKYTFTLLKSESIHITTTNTYMLTPTKTMRPANTVITKVRKVLLSVCKSLLSAVG